MNVNTIIQGDALNVLRELPDNSINCCVTSPPYYGLRDYGVGGQIGLEETPEAYIARLVDVFSEVKRILKPDGTLWLNIGDSYAGSYRGWSDNKRTSKIQTSSSYATIPNTYTGGDCKPKDLIGIPWMLAFALRANGWYLRQDIIWHKPNPMPESVRDRCTKSHEYIFLLTKSKNYFFDNKSISKPVSDSTIIRTSQDIDKQKGSTRVPGKTNGNMKACLLRYGGKKYTAMPDKFYRTKSGNMYNVRQTRNKRSVWEVSTKPFREAHFAVYPPELIIDCIKAGCPEGGIVLDPFMGSGTTAVVARKLNRNFVGIELNSKYIRISENRLKNELGIFL